MIERQSDTIEWIGLQLIKGRVSSGLVKEIDALIEGRVTNVFAIYDEIAALEGKPNARPSRWKAAAEFRGRWLTGLWHKHYLRSEMTSMVKNISNHWTGGRFEQMFVEEFGGKSMTVDEFAKSLSYRLVHDGYLQRAADSKLTGEWLVYAMQDGIRYYLTLGSHTESDEAIWQRCAACSTEFPDLMILKEERV